MVVIEAEECLKAIRKARHAIVKDFLKPCKILVDYETEANILQYFKWMLYVNTNGEPKSICGIPYEVDNSVDGILVIDELGGEHR